MKLSGQAPRAPTSMKTALPEAARALEHVWQQRRQELAAWQSSGQSSGCWLLVAERRNQGIMIRG